MSEATAYRILMVDDEPNVLSAYRRTIGRAFSLTVAEGGAAALELLDSPEPYAAIVSDMRMPQMSGLEFITAARARSRDSVYMMLTGNADQQTAVDAINQGHIFRFLNKPCAPELLESAIRAAITQYELVTAEKVLLRETFAGSIKFMIDALELSNPELFSFQSLVKQTQQQVCQAIGLRSDWQLSVAGSLCLIGLLAIPGTSAKKPLSDEVLSQAALLSARLLSHLPRIRPIVEMIRRQREPVVPLPADLGAISSDNYDLVGSQLLHFSVDLAREQHRLGSRPLALAQLAQKKKYDPRLIEALTAPARSTGNLSQFSIRKIPISEVAAGMVIESEIRKSDGTVFLSKGQTISELAAESLRNFADNGVVENTVTIRGEAAKAA